MHVVSSRPRTVHNRADEDKERISSNRASQCRRAKGDWLAQTISAKGIRPGVPTRGIAGAIRYTILVPTMSGRGKDCELRLALKPAHILLLASHGRSIDQGDSGTRRPQDDHDVCSLQPSFPGTPAFRDRSHCHSELKPRGGRKTQPKLTRFRQVQFIGNTELPIVILRTNVLLNLPSGQCCLLALNKTK